MFPSGMKWYQRESVIRYGYEGQSCADHMIEFKLVEDGLPVTSDLDGHKIWGGSRPSRGDWVEVKELYKLTSGQLRKEAVDEQRKKLAQVDPSFKPPPDSSEDKKLLEEEKLYPFIVSKCREYSGSQSVVVVISDSAEIAIMCAKRFYPQYFDRYTHPSAEPWSLEKFPSDTALSRAKDVESKRLEKMKQIKSEIIQRRIEIKKKFAVIKDLGLEVVKLEKEWQALSRMSDGSTVDVQSVESSVDSSFGKEKYMESHRHMSKGRVRGSASAKCKFFRSAAGCKLGESCRFSHS